MNNENLAETQYFEPGKDHPAAVEGNGPLAEFKPWVSIWTSPRLTIRQILNTDPTLYILPLICLIGIADFLENAANENAGDSVPVSVILLLAVVVGPIAGFVYVWLFSHLIRIVGNWLGGVAGYAQIKPALVWGSIPNAASLLLWIPIIAILGRDAFTSSAEFLEGDTFRAAIVICLGLQQIILGIWSVVLTSNTVAEVQGFQSAWKGLGNILLAGLVVVLPILLMIAVGLGIAVALGGMN